MRAKLLLLFCALLATATAAAQTPLLWQPIDPLTIADDDFARNRDPETWRDLSVERKAFVEGTTTWRLWRIANIARPAGPLWVVLHDNENATFAAALTALHSWGGVAIIVDTGPVDSIYLARFNREVAGSPIDPNRHFSDATPIYSGQMLADALAGDRLIVALHTNAPDFDPALSDCAAQRPGNGAISVGLCSDRYRPSPSRGQRWPFDDQDSLTLIPYREPGGRRSAYCGARLVAADFNLVFEHVASSDGSLSNYAVQHGLPYMNIETEERGSTPGGIATARDRLVAMIDQMMEHCGPVAGVSLSAPRRH